MPCLLYHSCLLIHASQLYDDDDLPTFAFNYFISLTLNKKVYIIIESKKVKSHHHHVYQRHEREEANKQEA